MIDVHTHIGRLNSSVQPLSAKMLVSIMDRHHIEQAVVLPIENPEELHYYSTTDYVIQECRKFPTRLIPFCCIDPRRGVPDQYSENVPQLVLKPRQMIERYIQDGCKGFGECLQGLPIDDPRSSRLYQACGEFELPVVLHICMPLSTMTKLGFQGWSESYNCIATPSLLRTLMAGGVKFLGLLTHLSRIVIRREKSLQAVEPLSYCRDMIICMLISQRAPAIMR